MPRNNFYAIAPTTPFLPCLADAVLDGRLLPNWPRDHAFWLSDITIYVPTKRARLALVDAFVERNGGSQLLPNIFTLGEGDDAENAFFTDPDVESLNVVSKTYRTAVLSQLIEAWAKHIEAGFSSPPSSVEILAMAQSLGNLIDDFETEEVDPKALNELVPDELAANWQTTLAFLKIAFEAWPQHLEEIGQISAARLRRERFDLASNSLHLRYGERPVIAAGSTGSVPATARFLKAIADLPNGAVILPGFDTEMSESDHADLIAPAKKQYAHPQYGMAQLLRILGTQVPAVVPLCGNQKALLTSLLHKSQLAPEKTSSWHGFRAQIDDGACANALKHISLLDAPNNDLEARAIALKTREAIENGKTVGVISPDRDLARRIQVELQRFDILVDDAAGVPLNQSPAGRWLRQVVKTVQSNFAPIDLLALLTNRHVLLGLPRPEVSRLRELMDISMMRGTRNLNGLDGYIELINNRNDEEKRGAQISLSDKDAAAIIELLNALKSALDPLCIALEKRQSLNVIARLVPDLIKNIFGEDPAQIAQFHGASELIGWSYELADCPTFGQARGDKDILSALGLLMQNVTVRPVETTRKDVQILGRIEARLLQADMMILAGLNEGVWPEDADPGPWLSRGMKIAVKLDPPERKIGLAAHDFVMAMGAPEVLLTYSKRRGTSPADPSRFLQRFEALIGEDATKTLLKRTDELQQWCALLDDVEAVRPAARPMPTPKAQIRPRRLSITEIETLIRDPYAIYAKHVLGLRKLRPHGAPPDAAERGDLIHKVMEDFVKANVRFDAPNAFDELMGIAQTHYQKLDDVADRKTIWLKRFEKIASRWIDYEREREPTISARHAENKGEAEIEVAGEKIKIFGYADRIDALKDGGLELIDFKTGGVPSQKDMLQFLSPQLPMEAYIAAQNGFSKIKAAPSHALTYIKLAHGPDAFQTTSISNDKTDLGKLVDDYVRHFSAFAQLLLLSDAHPMAAQLMPKENQQFPGDYEHLERIKEWMLDMGDEE
jgi:ATP-dependent helicase/nuclease subunit B